MQITCVKYGRTIEVGRFGHGRPSGRVWFGWEAELDEGETQEQALTKLQAMADAQETLERKAFDERHVPRSRGLGCGVSDDGAHVYEGSKTCVKCGERA